MKRSDMLNIITMTISLYEGGDVERLSENILKNIENVGMLPPIIEDTVYYPEYEGDTDSWYGQEDDYTPVGYLKGWEPEDEA